MPSITITDLNNAKQDVDHIAEIATSTSDTATDRLGHVKKTLAGAVGTIAAITNRGAWVTGTAYALKDLVSNSGTWYICVAAHTSSAAFSTDSASKWRVYQGVIAQDLAAPSGASLVGTKRTLAGAVATTLSNWIEAQPVNLKADFAAAEGVGVSSKIQAAIDALALLGGGVVVVPEGTWTIDATLILKTGVKLRGEGYGVTILKLATGANVDVIRTEGFGTFASLSDAGVPRDFGIEALTIDGNYLNDAWNNATNTVNNSTGYGVKCEGYGFTIDIEMRNIPEVGLRIAGEGSAPTTQDVFSRVSVFGRVFGKEGMIVTGPNDFQVHEAFLGLCGILPRPVAETTVATSTEYPGEKIDGIVFDGVNIEYGTIHVYACWNGRGFRTRNTCRLEGEHLISESNNAGIWLSSSTYGASSKFSVRSNGIYHPNWSATAPAYTPDANGLDPNWDAVTLDCGQYQVGEYFNFRTVVSATRVAGWKSLVINGDSNRVGFTHRNSTDSVTADLYAGDAVVILGHSNLLNATLNQVNGNGIREAGTGNTITFTDKSGKNGYAYGRDGGATNANKGRVVNGTVISSSATRVAFNSIQGTPTPEIISLSYDLPAGATPFSGTIPDFTRSQQWNLSGNVGTTRSATKTYAQFNLDETTTVEQTVTVAHGFPYTPDYRQVDWSIDDRSTSSDGVIAYVQLQLVDATNLTFKTKMTSAATNGANNRRVNVRIS